MEKQAITISAQQLEDALFHVQEMCERAQIPFMLFGNTAKHVYRGEGLEGDEEVNIGVKKGELTDHQFRTLKQFIPHLEANQYQLSYTHNGVPVLIDVIHTEYKVFKEPDTKFFMYEFFKIPNPFEEYWQKRDFVK
jgi:hypothetical protein